MRKNLHHKSKGLTLTLTRSSTQLLPLITNPKGMTARSFAVVKQATNLRQATLVKTSRNTPPSENKPASNNNSSTDSNGSSTKNNRPVYFKSKRFAHTMLEQKNELLTNKSKTMLYFQKEIKLMEENLIRLQREAEEREREEAENAAANGGELTLQRSKTTIELGSSLPYTPSFQCQLDKRQRFEIYKRRLNIKKGVKSAEEAIELINKTMDEIEDKYAPKKDDKVYPIYSKRYGRMFPIPNERIRYNEETGLTECLTTGMIVYIRKDGSFEMWTVPRGMYESKKLFFKNGAV